MKIKERLYLTEDRKRVVNENMREGRYLFAKPGDDIPDAVARVYGLLPEEKRPEQKMNKRPEDKMAEKPQDKEDFKTDEKVGKTRGLKIKRLKEESNG